MEGGGRVLIDASAYMLYEASGDSEAECLFEGEAVEDEDNDAQSCSMEWTSEHGVMLQQLDDVEDCCEDEGSGYNSDDEDDDEDGVVDQCPLKRKLDNSNNNSSEKQNQREKDRLFWEECLAS